ncbi:MAG TPA: hypothetical protein PLR65_14170 [Anaerolineales bacterium]|nr:hypothetical protein [Anaerolineales bacterium]
MNIINILKTRQVQKIGIALMAVVGLSFVLAPFVPPAIDWTITFRPATLTLLSGLSPYGRVYYVHAPWTLIPLIPLAVLPESVGRVMLFFCSLASYAFVAHKLGAKPIAVTFLLASPLVMPLLLNGNMDWLAILGFIMPPQIGLFFISIKPQAGIAVAPFWLVEAWRKGGWRLVVKTFAPFTVVLLLSFVPFGFWPLEILRNDIAGVYFNASLWPMSIPVGLALFVTALRKRKLEYAMAASPCLSPYVLFYSWGGALLAIVSSVPETIAAVIGLWILVAIRYFS